MTESTSGMEEKSLGRMGSLKKLLKSPSRTFPKSKPKHSKSSFTRFFSKKKSGKEDKEDKDDDENSVWFDNKHVEHGKEEFEAMDDKIPSHTKEDANTKNFKDEEIKQHDLVQVTKELVITNENLYNEIKEGMEKVHEGLDKVVHAFEFRATTNDKSSDVQQPPQHEVAVEQLQEVEIDAPSSIEQVTREIKDNLEKTEPLSKENEGVLNDEETTEQYLEGNEIVSNEKTTEHDLEGNEVVSNDKETIEEKKWEDNCVSSLAQGLGKICTIWSANKED